MCIGALASILAMSSQALASSGSNPFEGRGSLAPQIINGQEASISQFPWQVYVLHYDEAEGIEGACGGSILDASHILTAAHCVDHEGTISSYPAGEFIVFAGTSMVFGFGGPLEDFLISPGAQSRSVDSLRTDPYYTVSPPTDDVAILTLHEPLELSAATNTQPIGLVATGGTPAPGTTLSISGYGKEEGAESAQSNGRLYATTLTAISSDACRAEVSVNSAVLLCAVSASSSTCQGDSGGPLTEGSPAVQVGIVDFGAKECPVGVPDVFTNVAAPEIRGFIEGSESPPVAVRSTSPPVVKPVGPAPVDFSPLSCEPGGWTTPPTSFTYTFQVENASAQVLQSGPTNVFTPPSTVVGSPLVCIVQASSPGGVTTARSATTAAIAADTMPPVASITARKCKLQKCTLSIAASDPNAVALTVDTAAAYSVTAKCPKKKKKKKGKRSVCHETKTVPMSVTNPSAGVYQASVSRLPYSEKITFTILAANAAGLTQVKPALTAITLHKPKPKKPTKKPKKRK
ncbi:MAG TPA: serine protease [Solirubrobacteraceae bacterium]